MIVQALLKRLGLSGTEALLFLMFLDAAMVFVEPEERDGMLEALMDADLSTEAMRWELLTTWMIGVHRVLEANGMAKPRQDWLDDDIRKAGNSNGDTPS